MRNDDNGNSNENMINNNNSSSNNTNIMLKTSISTNTSNSNINSNSIPSSPITPRSVFDRRNSSIVNKKYHELRGADNADDIISDDDNDGNNSDINDEEDGDIIIQRRNYKNRATLIDDKNSKPLPSPLWSKGNDDDDDDTFATDTHKNHDNQNYFFNKSKYLEKKKVQEKKINAITQCMDRVLNKKHIITIKDYDFLVKSLYIVLGETVEFRLASDVPLHAEHQLIGDSDAPLLRFESLLLIQEENTSYAFTPICTGEIHISCKIYTEMTCEVIVVESLADLREISKGSTNILDNNILKDEEDYYIYKNKEDIKKTSMKLIAAFTKYSYHQNMEADIGIGSKVYFNGSTKSESESFCDSDDFVSVYSEAKDDDNQSLMSPVRNIDSIISSPKGHNDIDVTYINTYQDQASFKVYIEDFAFRPATLTVTIDSKVDFITDGNASHKLNCDDEYEGVSLEGTGACYSHVFKRVGKYRVRDEIFSFMCCVIHVVDTDIKSDSKTLISKYPNLNIQDTTNSLIDTLASICLMENNIVTIPSNDINVSLSNDSFDADDDENPVDDRDARRRAKKNRKKKAQRAKKRQEELQFMSKLALIEQENAQYSSIDNDTILDSKCVEDDAQTVEDVPIILENVESNIIIREETVHNHDIDINLDETDSNSISEITQDALCAVTSVNQSESNNTTLLIAIPQKKREKKRRVRKPKSQDTRVQNDEKLNGSEIDDKVQSNDIKSFNNEDNQINEVESDIYTLLQEKLNRSSKARTTKLLSHHMPPMHIINSYITSAENFFADKWNELDLSRGQIDCYDIIYINENNESNNGSQDNNNLKNRRRSRTRRSGFHKKDTSH